MADLFKPTFQDHRTGQTRQSRFWYARIRGKRIALKVTDRRIADRKAQEIERHLELGNDPAQLDKARRRPITEHLTDFEESLRSRGVGDRHLENILPRIRKTIDGCSIRTLANVDAEKIEAWLARQQRSGLLSAQTRKHYAVHLKQLGRWLVATGRAAKNPFAALRTSLNVQNDRRHLRRAILPDELQALLTTTAAGAVTRCKMTGRQRCLCYAVALGTGLRRNEIGSLTPESFDLKTDPPVVKLSGAYTKNRKHATLPLRRDLADRLQEWLRGRAPGEVLFPIKDKQVNYMIQADLEAAGAPYVKEDRTLDFHALRVSFVSSLALSGVPLATAQKLARHSDPRLTANVYTHLGLADLSRAVESLPPLPGANPDAGGEQKNGRQDDPPRATAG
jgi:integrase